MADTTGRLAAVNKIQLHYWFGDKSHTMDALVHNKCEREWLEMTRTIASIGGVSIKMETEPSARGGLKCGLTITPKSEKKTPAIKISMITSLVVAAMITPANGSITGVANALLDQLLPDEAITPEQEHQYRQDLLQLRSGMAERFAQLDQSSVIKKRRSNFYALLIKYPKVKKVSWLMERAKKPVVVEQTVNREDFSNHVLVTDQLKPEVLENVQVEITSPVLRGGKFKWKGLYNGSPISFSMKSDEFMALVQSGKVEFKHGTTISCTLEIERKINSAGMERITGYSIVRVNSYQESGKPAETAEGKQHKQKQEAGRKQLNLFGE